MMFFVKFQKLGSQPHLRIEALQGIREELEININQEFVYCV